MAKIERKSEVEEFPERCVHHLPCLISYDGPAAVATRFVIDRNDSTSGELASSFRGRKLVGLPFDLPEGYEAAKVPQLESVIKKSQLKMESDESANESEDISLEDGATIRKFVSWHLDYAPVKGLASDPLYNSLSRWLALANVVHCGGQPKEPETTKQ